jgi:hypothetical protein
MTTSQSKLLTCVSCCTGSSSHLFLSCSNGRTTAGRTNFESQLWTYCILLHFQVWFYFQERWNRLGLTSTGNRFWNVRFAMWIACLLRYVLGRSVGFFQQGWSWASWWTQTGFRSYTFLRVIDRSHLRSRHRLLCIKSSRWVRARIKVAARRWDLAVMDLKASLNVNFRSRLLMHQRWLTALS